MAMPTELDRASFWSKAKRLMGRVSFIPDAVALYYCLIDRASPAWVKVQATAALVYFVFPLDLIPDAFFPVGYTDDAAMMAATLAAVGGHVTPEHRARAAEALGLPAELEP